MGFDTIEINLVELFVTAYLITSFVIAITSIGNRYFIMEQLHIYLIAYTQSFLQ